PMSIDLNAIKFTNFDVDYGDDNSKTYAKVLFKELSAEIDKLDLQNNSFEIDKILLSGARLNADLFLPETSNEENTKDSISSSGSTPKLVLRKLELNDVQAVYNNTAVALTNQGIDFNHLDFSNLNLEVQDFQMENNEFIGRIESAEIQEKSGLNIQEFRTDFAYQSQQAFLKNLYLQTPQMILRDEIVLNYSSIEQLSEDLGNVAISADLYNSKIGFSDILALAPDLRNTAPFNKYPNASLHLDAEINGIVNDLLIQNLEVSGLDDLKLKVRGRLRNATNPENIYYDLNISELSSSAKTIYNLVPPNTIPSN